jgi:DNA polymerase IV
MTSERPDPVATPAVTDRWLRAIAHVDMDAFYVAVEQARDPSLVGRPVVVGGTGRRGVVASASYEARAFGVRSAMATSEARRRCPGAVFLPGDHARYGAESRRIMAVFRRFTPLVEPLSLDEAFLDVTGAQRRLGDPPRLGALVRDAVSTETGLACSVGVAPNKFLAKLASESAKPRPGPGGPTPGCGVRVVPPGAELAFLHPLPLPALWGVGPATLARLHRLGLATVGDLARIGEEALVRALGRANGRHLHRLAHGVDDRPVEVDRSPKSIGHEETFPHDRTDRRGLEDELVRLGDAVARRLRDAGLAGRTVTLKLRYGDFRTLTRSHTVAHLLDDGVAVAAQARALLDGLDVADGVRLVGVSVSGLVEPGARQLTLDLAHGSDDPGGPARRADSWQDANATVDAIRSRFGEGSIGPATLADRHGLRVLRQGEAQWGPVPAGGTTAPVPDEDEPRSGGAPPQGGRRR